MGYPIPAVASFVRQGWRLMQVVRLCLLSSLHATKTISSQLTVPCPTRVLARPYFAVAEGGPRGSFQQERLAFSCILCGTEGDGVTG